MLMSNCNLSSSMGPEASHCHCSQATKQGNGARLANDVLHPPPHLTSCKPLWSDTSLVDVTSQCHDDWKSALVVDSSLVVDPTIRQTGFHLPRSHWSLFSNFQTPQAHCGASDKLCGLLDNVEKPKQCLTLSMTACRPSLMVACITYVQVTRLQLIG